MREGLAIALIAFSLLVFELLLTRLFAVVLFSDLAHLTLALAMLGVGVGALAQQRWAWVRADDVRGGVARLAALQALATLGAVAFVVNAPLLAPAAEGMADTWFVRWAARFSTLNWGWFAGMVLAVALPSVLGGAAIAGALQHRRERLGVLYGADLGGAALGALVAMPLVAWMNGPDAGLVAAAAAALAAVVLAPAGRTRLAGGAVLGGLLALGGFALVQGPVLEIRSAAAWTSGEVVETRWTPLTRLTRYREDHREMILLDNASLSEVVTDPKRLELVAAMPNRGLVYEAGVAPGPAAILAAAAGPEVATALDRGFAPIDAIDIEGDIFEMVEEGFDTPLNPYRDARVNRVEADARAAIAAAPDGHYQVIQLLNANLFGAAGRMSQAWSPSLLLTEEALGLYLDKIAPDGVISLTGLGDTRWLAPAAAGVLAERGAESPYRHIAYLGGEHEVLLLRPRPWTAPERRALQRGLRGARLVLDPLRPRPDPIATLTREPAAFSRLHGRPLAALPPPPPMTDDHPYPDTLQRVSIAVAEARFPDGLLYWTLIGQGLVVLLLGGVFIGLPLAERRTRRAVRGALPTVATVACFGAGYLGIEVVLMNELTLFIGHPSAALVTVIVSMLLGSGIGSALTGRVPDAQAATALRAALVAVLAVGLAHALLIAPALSEHLQHLPQPARVAIASLSILPLGGVLGLCFPLTLRGAAPEVVPWAWAVNGWASVAGGVATLVVVRLAGFSTALVLALAAYGVALVVQLAVRLAAARTPEAARPREQAQAAK